MDHLFPLPPAEEVSAVRRMRRRYRANCIQLEFRPQHTPTTEQWEYANRSAYYKACELIGNYGYTPSDHDDIAAELIGHIVAQAPHWDPSRAGWSTYVQRIVGSRVRNMIDARKAAKRDYRKCVSLDALSETS